MTVFILEIMTFCLYIGLFAYAWQKLSRGQSLHQATTLILGLAVFAHGVLAYLLIDGNQQGQNLSLFNIFSMTTWLAMCLVGWNLLKHQANSLLLISLPIAAFSILEVALFSGSSLIQLKGKPINLFHILTGIGAMSILLLAALQSILVLYLNHELKTHPARVHHWLGPLQSMERYLIQLLTTGFLMMSVSLVLVLLIPSELMTHQAIHKVVLTVASWIVLATLMFGRYIKEWQGVYSAKWSLVGVFLLLLGYFGSKLVIEFMLQ